MKKSKPRFQNRQAIIEAIDLRITKRDEAADRSNSCSKEADDLLKWFLQNPPESVDENDQVAVRAWHEKRQKLVSLREQAKAAKGTAARASLLLQKLGDALAEMDTAPMPSVLQDDVSVQMH